MTRDELHRAIAEALEPNPSQMNSDDVKWWGIFYRAGKNAPSFYPLNFSTSDSAAARLLDAMPYITLSRRNSEWWCYGDGKPIGVGKDRKTAVLLAAKAWLNIEGELEL